MKTTLIWSPDLRGLSFWNREYSGIRELFETLDGSGEVAADGLANAEREA